MLTNLDNEVIFKKAFTDKLVFTTFVHDVLGIDVVVDKIETEKRFTPKVGCVDFKLDIFAETVDRRVVIEIQRVEYDHNFDRFLHYFLMVIAEQQKNAKQYGLDQTVYIIVVLTAPYTILDKTKQAVLDEVLLVALNPRTLSGQVRDLYGHQMIFLNPNHSNDDTPASIRDWLALIYQSIYNPKDPVLNRDNAGIRRAAELIDFDNLTPEERADAKNTESARVAKIKYEEAAHNKGMAEGTAKGMAEGTAKGMAEGTAKGMAKGMAEGTAKGMAERNHEIARIMKASGESVDKISLFTGLSAGEIGKL